MVEARVGHVAVPVCQSGRGRLVSASQLRWPLPGSGRGHAGPLLRLWWEEPADRCGEEMNAPGSTGVHAGLDPTVFSRKVNHSSWYRRYNSGSIFRKKITKQV